MTNIHPNISVAHGWCCDDYTLNGFDNAKRYRLIQLKPLFICKSSLPNPAQSIELEKSCPDDIMNVHVLAAPRCGNNLTTTFCIVCRWDEYTRNRQNSSEDYYQSNSSIKTMRFNEEFQSIAGTSYFIRWFDDSQKSKGTELWALVSVPHLLLTHIKDSWEWIFKCILIPKILQIRWIKFKSFPP